MDGWIDGWMDGWMIGWMAKQTQRDTHTHTHTHIYIYISSPLYYNASIGFIPKLFNDVPISSVKTKICLFYDVQISSFFKGSRR